MPKLQAPAAPARLPTRPSELPDVSLVAVDTETSGLFVDDGARLSVVSLAWWEHRCDNPDECAAHECAIGVAFPFDQGHGGKSEDTGQDSLFDPDGGHNLPEAEWRALLAWLLQRRLVFHHLKFDAHHLLTGTRHWAGVDSIIDRCVWDTQLANKELWPTESTSLGPTSRRLFGEDEGKQDKLIKAYLRRHKLPAGRYDLVPWDIIGPYAARDAILTLRLEKTQRLKITRMNELNRDRATHWITRALDVARMLYQVENRGVPYDAAESARIAAELRKTRDRIGKNLPFTPTDEHAKQYYFGPAADKTSRGVECLGLRPYATSPKTGEPSLTVDIVDQMVEENIPHAAEWRDWSKLDTAISMWYQGYAVKIGTDGRLRANFRQVEVKSNRLSVERVNLQAIPSDFKMTKGTTILAGYPTPRNLITRAVTERMPGWGLYEIDLSQAELRLAARLAGCETMLRAFEDGTDLHGYTAKTIFGIDETHPRWGLYRQLGKRCNFSCVFGAGPKTVAHMVLLDSGIRLSDKDARRAVEGWNDLYPEYDRALDMYEGVAKRTRRVRLINGHLSYFRPYEDYRAGFSRKVQGSLAELGLDLDLMIEGYLAKTPVQELADRDGIGGAGLVMMVHDSQLLLLPDGSAGHWLHMITEACADYATQFCGVKMTVDSKEWCYDD